MKITDFSLIAMNDRKNTPICFKDSSPALIGLNTFYKFNYKCRSLYIPVVAQFDPTIFYILLFFII